MVKLKKAPRFNTGRGFWFLLYFFFSSPEPFAAVLVERTSFTSLNFFGVLPWFVPLSLVA